MQPKTKNATFATQCNPYQKVRYNSIIENHLTSLLLGDFFNEDSLVTSDLLFFIFP